MRIFFKGLITNIVFTAILFLCADRLSYIQGWIFLLANIAASYLNYFTLRKNIDLAQERSKIQEGAKSWDKLLLGLSAIAYLAILIIAGLDSGRFLWTKYFSFTLSVSGVIVLLLGQVIFITARSQNNFFSSVMRIQKERGHIVVNTGLYKIVRHPGYLGMIISLAAVPLITTSFWSTIPAIIAILLLIIRTMLEDKTLKEELSGYIEYSAKTRYKLIPYIW